MYRFFFILTVAALFLSGCGCDAGRGGRAIKIGVDPNWYPIDFGAQNSYVNGFTEDLLLEIAIQTGIEFERIPANWDTLNEGMKQEKYQAVLTSMPSYEFNLAQYDFSHNFLGLGPVLIVPEGAHRSDLGKMGGEHIGVIAGDPAVLILQKHGGLIVRNYPSIPELLEAVVSGEIDGALLDRIPAVNYVGDLFAGKLKITGPPLTDAGLHLMAVKNKQLHLIAQFNKSLAILKKKKRLQALLRKWGLDCSC